MRDKHPQGLALIDRARGYTGGDQPTDTVCQIGADGSPFCKGAWGIGHKEPALSQHTEQALAPRSFFGAIFYGASRGKKRGKQDFFIGGFTNKKARLGEVRAGRGYRPEWSGGAGFACEARTCKGGDTATAQPYTQHSLTE